MSERFVVGLFINPAHQSHMMPAKYGLTWIVQHDLSAWWLTDKQLAQVIKYYRLDEYWE